MTPVRNSSAAVWTGIAALYVAATAAYAWPLLRAFHAALPHDAGDPGLTAWMMWWNSQAVPLTTRWWNAPIFYPLHGAFAMSETLLAPSILTTPLHWLGVGAVPAYNAAFLLSFPLSALASHALAHRLTGRHDAGLIAGLAFGFGAYRAAQIPHVQMEWAMFMPFCLLALHRYLDERRPRDLVLAAVCWVLNALSCAYFLVFFAVLAGLWMLWFCRTRRDWLAIGAAMGAATALLAPLLWGYAHYQQQLGLSRSAEEIEEFSADLTAYWATSIEPWLAHRWTWDPYPEGAFYPGVVVLALAIAGAVVAWRRVSTRRRSSLQLTLAAAGLAADIGAVFAYRAGGWRTVLTGVELSVRHPERLLWMGCLLIAIAVLMDPRTRSAWRRRSPQVFYAAAALVMVWFSLGPVGRFSGRAFLHATPYSLLMLLPGASGMRAPARFGVLVVLCLAQAAALGFGRLVRRSSLLLASGIALAVAADGWVLHFPIANVADVAGVAAGGDVSVPVLELPMANPYTDIAAMLRATVHRHPLVNGYSGYGPAHYDALQEALNAGDPSALKALTTFGPLLVSINRAADRNELQADYAASAPGAVLQYRAGLGPVYRLPATAMPLHASDPELPIAYVDANQNFVGLPRLLDRDLQTWWQTQEPQSVGDQLVIVFDAPVRLSRIDLDLSTSTLDYPRKLRVEAADLDAPAATLWEGRTAGLAILGALSDHLRAPVRIDLAPGALARRFTLTTLERQRDHHWSIAEVRAFGRRE